LSFHTREPNAPSAGLKHDGCAGKCGQPRTDSSPTGGATYATGRWGAPPHLLRLQRRALAPQRSRSRVPQIQTQSKQPRTSNPKARYRALTRTTRTRNPPNNGSARLAAASAREGCDDAAKPRPDRTRPFPTMKITHPSDIQVASPPEVLAQAVALVSTLYEFDRPKVLRALCAYFNSQPETDNAKNP